MKHFQAQKKFAIGALVTGIFAFFFVLLGVLSPAWIVTPGNTNTTIQEGIWYAVACSKTCVASSRDWIFNNFSSQGSFSTLEEVYWQQFRVLTLCAIEGSLNAILAAAIVLVRRRKSSNPVILIIGLVSSLAACIMVLIPVLKVVVVTGNIPGSWRINWSRTVSGVGCLIQFACSVLYVFAVSQNCLRIIKNKDHRRDSRADAISETSVVFDTDIFIQLDCVSSPLGGAENPFPRPPSYSEFGTVPLPPAYTEIPDVQPVEIPEVRRELQDSQSAVMEVAT